MSDAISIGVIQFAVLPNYARALPGYLTRRLAEAIADTLGLAGLAVRCPLLVSRPPRRYLRFTAPPNPPLARDYAAQLGVGWLLVGTLASDADGEELELDLQLYDADGVQHWQQHYHAPQRPDNMAPLCAAILAHIGVEVSNLDEAVATTLGTADELALFSYWRARDVSPRYGLVDDVPNPLVDDVVPNTLHLCAAGLEVDPDYLRAAALFAESALDLSAGEAGDISATLQQLSWLKRLTAGAATASIVARAYFSLALGAEQRRDNQLALQLYDLALAAERDNPASLAHAGDLLYRMEMKAAALPLLLRACELNPTDDNSAFLAARVYEKREQFDAALRWYGEAGQRRADFWQAHFYAADLLRRLGRGDEAVAEFNRTLAIDPAQAQTHAELGATLAELGRPAEALPHLELAAAAMPGVTEIQTNIATVLQMLGILAVEQGGCDSPLRQPA